eukprot:c26487_g1_i1 orf=370-2076(+)
MIPNMSLKSCHVATAGELYKLLPMQRHACNVHCCCVPVFNINSVKVPGRNIRLQNKSTEYDSIQTLITDSVVQTEGISKRSALIAHPEPKQGYTGIAIDPVLGLKNSKALLYRKAFKRAYKPAAPQCLPVNETYTNGGASMLDSKSDSKHVQKQKDDSLPLKTYDSDPIAKELSVLESYFSKLHKNVLYNPVGMAYTTRDANQITGVNEMEQRVASDASSCSTFVAENEKEMSPITKQSNGHRELQKLDSYLDKKSEDSITPKDLGKDELEENQGIVLQEIFDKIEKAHISDLLYQAHREADPESEFTANPGGSESYMLYVLAALNIAIFIFGLASPIQTADVGMSTLPLLFGAKVNRFVLDGQWWRLITSMFLHSDFFHIFLSSWALLSFGPRVERVYGSLAFCMIYFLGGLCGNILSFFHTNDATVGGTGPFFAILSSWIVYLLQNRIQIGKESADSGIQMAIVSSAPLITLSCLLPIDNWIHLGAFSAGLLFGAFACPIMQMKTRDMHIKAKDSLKGGYMICDRPSALKLMLVFGIFIACCFGIFSLASPTEAEFQGLDERYWTF